MSGVIARRRTYDNKSILLWGDGSLTWALGHAIRGAWHSPSTKNQTRALTAGWLVIGECEVYDANEVTELARAARWSADRDGLPGTMRNRMHRKRLSMKPVWTVLQTDRSGRAVDRCWVLPRIGRWAGYAVFNAGGRYELWTRVPGSDSTYTTTGFRWRTLAATCDFLASEPRPTANGQRPTANGRMFRLGP